MSDAEDRKEQFQSQLRQSEHPSRQDYEKQFTVSMDKKKRELTSLGMQIEFIGAGAAEC